MCKYDVLVLSRLEDLGTRQASQDAAIAEIERADMRVNVLTGNTA